MNQTSPTLAHAGFQRSRSPCAKFQLHLHSETKYGAGARSDSCRAGTRPRSHPPQAGQACPAAAAFPQAEPKSAGSLFPGGTSRARRPLAGRVAQTPPQRPQPSSAFAGGTPQHPPQTYRQASRTTHEALNRSRLDSCRSACSGRGGIC